MKKWKNSEIHEESKMGNAHEQMTKPSGRDLRSTKAASRSKGNPSEITAREPLKLEFGRNSVRFGFENVGNERNRDEIKSAPLKFNEFSFVQHSFIITEDDSITLFQFPLHLTLTYPVYTAGNNCQQGGTIC
uniref:Uncharacterized protein n=1 Tax=Glossina palpalis gambiensis TaxID=67801 RepID=A0A1B0B3U9_9MUSC